MVKTKTKIFTADDVSRIESEYSLLTDNLYRCDKEGDKELIDKRSGLPMRLTVICTETPGSHISSIL